MIPQTMNNQVERRSSSRSRYYLFTNWRVRVCAAHSIIFTGWLLFISVTTTTTTASNQHQRVRRSNTYNTNSNAQQYQYDRSVTTFDPNGQLLQVQYAQYAATQQTYRTMMAMILHNTIYVVVRTTKESDDNVNNTNKQKNVQTPITRKKTTITAITNATVVTDSRQEEEEEEQVQQQQQQQVQQYMYRISKHIYMVGMGLIGDIRIIAAHLRVEVQQYIYNYEDEISVEMVATILTKLQHTCTYQSGIRPLAVSCFIFGYDPYNDSDNDDDHHSLLPLDESDSYCSKHYLPPQERQRQPQQYAKLYKCSPGGIIEDCSYCTSGYNEMEILQHLQEPYHQQWNIIHTTGGSNNMTRTDEIIEQLVMIIHNSSVSSSNNNDNGLSTMDVWVVQSDNQDDNDRTNTSMTSPKWKASRERKSVTCFAGLCIGTNNNKNYDSFMKVRNYYGNNETILDS